MAINSASVLFGSVTVFVSVLVAVLHRFGLVCC